MFQSQGFSSSYLNGSTRRLTKRQGVQHTGARHLASVHGAPLWGLVLLSDEQLNSFLYQNVYPFQEQNAKCFFFLFLKLNHGTSGISRLLVASPDFGGGVNAFASALTGGSRCLRGTCRNGHPGTQAHPSQGVGVTGQKKAALVRCEEGSSCLHT